MFLCYVVTQHKYRSKGRTAPENSSSIGWVPSDPLERNLEPTVGTAPLQTQAWTQPCRVLTVRMSPCTSSTSPTPAFCQAQGRSSHTCKMSTPFCDSATCRELA